MESKKYFHKYICSTIYFIENRNYNKIELLEII